MAIKQTVRFSSVRSASSRLLDRAADVFGADSQADELVVDLKELHAKIGQLTLEKDFLQGALSKAGLLIGRK